MIIRRAPSAGAARSAVRRNPKAKIFGMERKAYGRDFGLSARMVTTMFLLGALYVAFFIALLQFTNIGIGFLILIMGGLAFLQYYTSDKIALRASGAKVVERDQAPELHDMVERLCAMADLPKPRLAVIPTDVPNAFATGRNPKNSVVAVTEGLWRRLSKPEVEGVIAHELSHIGNRDVAIMTISSFFAMVAALLMRMGLWGGMFGGGRDRSGGPPIWLIMFVVSMITYVVSYVLILMISRYREYAADRGAAMITGAPENLMSALQRIASNIAQIPQRDLREVQGMNAFFIVPTNVKSSFAELFMTHPPLEKRLARLADIAREMGRPV
jgi:heat shock protein HtpX